MFCSKIWKIFSQNSQKMNPSRLAGRVIYLFNLRRQRSLTDPVPTRDVKSPHDFHLTSGKRWGDPRWFKITSPHPWKIEVVWKSPHLTSKKNRGHLKSPHLTSKKSSWFQNHLTSPQKKWGDLKITSPHLAPKSKFVVLERPKMLIFVDFLLKNHLTSPHLTK